jgi:hypothetical protein
MNYIKHLRLFYDTIRHDQTLSAVHVSLYNALFQIWNNNHFKNPFAIDRTDLMNLSKIKTKYSYYRAMKILDQKGLIIYQPAKNRFTKAMVFMVDLKSKIPPQKMEEKTPS